MVREGNLREGGDGQEGPARPGTQPPAEVMFVLSTYRMRRSIVRFMSESSDTTFWWRFSKKTRVVPETTAT